MTASINVASEKTNVDLSLVAWLYQVVSYLCFINNTSSTRQLFILFMLGNVVRLLVTCTLIFGRKSVS